MKRVAAITSALAGLAALAVFLTPAGATSESLACGSGTHGSAGYAYAGLQSGRVGSGVRATITAFRQPAVAAGHAAGWIGVGGPGAGPNGETMWLQTGVAALPNMPLMIYVEITRPGRAPSFVPLRQDVAVGESHRLAVLEMNRRPGVWRVWLDGKPVTDPIVLPGSHRQWEPLATAESWNGGTATCNGFGFRFERVGLARSLGGSWQTFVPGYTFRDRGYAVRQLSPSPRGQRTLSAGSPAAYAFDALSA
ncbi:MAG TPA: hypothetical protein VFG75_03910 [Gaiella sp.]|nr:hypothetical protein [Gaiella sp.]